MSGRVYGKDVSCLDGFGILEWGRDGRRLKRRGKECCGKSS